MANQWFKFYGAEYLSDPKMDRLTVQERSCWITLLCMASQSNGVIKFLSVEGLLVKSGVRFNAHDSTEWDNAQNVLHNFELYEMIKVNINGSIEILNWEKRQEHNLTVAERVAKSRANKKSNENVTINVTDVTSEENRIEENRREENNLSETSSLSELKTKSKKIKEKQEDVELNKKAIKFIEIYASIKKVEVNKGFQSRHIKIAKEVLKYPKNKISASISYCEENYEDWGMETIIKVIEKGLI